jgi:hypothetical protein
LLWILQISIEKYLLGCVSRVNKIPPYSVILTITILSNGFNNNKRKVYISSPQPKWDIVLNFESKNDKVYKTSPEITTTEKPVTHLNKYKK